MWYNLADNKPHDDDDVNNIFVEDKYSNCKPTDKIGFSEKL